MPLALAIRRVTRDLQELQKDPSVGSCEPTDGDLTRLVARFSGPKGSPYEEGIFTLDIHIPEGYPHDPPRVNFKQFDPLFHYGKVDNADVGTSSFVYHPNVTAQSGEICVDILKPGSWSPTQTLRSVILSICSLLSDPNPDSPLEWTIAEHFRKDPPGYAQRAKEFTKLYATGEVAINADNAHSADLALAKFVAMGFPHALVAAVLEDLHYTGQVDQHDEILQKLITMTEDSNMA